MIQVTGFWRGEPRPIETNLSVSPGGTLRIQHRERWIECNAKEFLLAALAGEVPRGPMKEWKDAVDLPGDSVIDITSTETAGSTALVTVSAGTIALENFVSGDLKQVLRAVAQGMYNSKVEPDLIESLRAVWWS